MKAPAAAGARAFFGLDMASPEVWALAGGEVAVFSSGLAAEPGSNEDGAAVIALAADRCLLAVADGVGALPGGRDASRLALEQLVAAVSAGDAAGAPLRESILDGFEAANREILALGSGAGTTLAAVEVRDRQVRSYHVGDAAVLLVGQRGKLKHLTTAHSPVGYAVEAGMMDEEEALVHEDRHVISNMIGSPGMKIEMGPVLALAPRDTLLVASDGVFDNLRIEEITEAIRKGPIDAVAAAAARRCRARMDALDGDPPGKPDDLTLVIWRPAPRA